MDSLLASLDNLRLSPADDEFDLPDDGPGAQWRGLNKAARAIWIQFYQDAGEPPRTVTKCVRGIKLECFVNLNELFSKLIRGKSFADVQKFPSEAALRANIQKTKPFPLSKAKGMMLQPLLVNVWIGER